MAHLASIGAGVGVPVPSPDSDDVMVGCLLALLGALVAIGLRPAWRRSSSCSPAATTSSPGSIRRQRSGLAMGGEDGRIITLNLAKGIGKVAVSRR